MTNDGVADSIVYYHQFVMLFASAMLRGALMNLRMYMQSHRRNLSLGLRLLEYQSSMYLSGLFESPLDRKVVQAVADHRAPHLRSPCFNELNRLRSSVVPTQTMSLGPEVTPPQDDVNWEEIENAFAQAAQCKC